MKSSGVRASPAAETSAGIDAPHSTDTTILLRSCALVLVLVVVLYSPIDYENEDDDKDDFGCCSPLCVLMRLAYL